MTETTTEYVEVALRNKFKSILQEDTTLNNICTSLSLDRVKIYKGRPPAVNSFPAVILEYERDMPHMAHKTKNGWKEEFTLNVFVAYKQYNREDREDILLKLTRIVIKAIEANRIMDCLRASDNSWMVYDAYPEEVLYENWPGRTDNKEWVLNASLIKYKIVVEGKL